VDTTVTWSISTRIRSRATACTGPNTLEATARSLALAKLALALVSSNYASSAPKKVMDGQHYSQTKKEAAS
jgi:hypothetical protein